MATTEIFSLFNFAKTKYKIYLIGIWRKNSVLLAGETRKIRDEKYYQEGKDFSRQLQLIQAHIGDLTKVNEMVRCSDETKFYDVNNTMCTADGKRRGGKKWKFFFEFYLILITRNLIQWRKEYDCVIQWLMLIIIII